MKPSRILIVEDEIIVSKEISQHLEAMGYEPPGTGAQRRAGSGNNRVAAPRPRPDGHPPQGGHGWNRCGQGDSNQIRYPCHFPHGLFRRRYPGEGPANALLEGEPFVCNECRDDLCPLWQRAAELGLKSCGAFPLSFQGNIWGTLSVCASEPGFFRDREIKLLQEIAMDISFALEKLEGNLQREHALKALAESEKRLCRAEQVAHIGHWELDLTSKEMRGSDGAMLIYGLEGDQWPMTEVQKVPLPEYRPVLDNALKALIEEGKPYSLEFKIRRPIDGQIRDIHSMAEYSPDNRVVFGVIHDVTERKKAEEELRTQKETLARIFENSPSIMMIGIKTSMSPIPTVSGWHFQESRLKRSWAASAERS